MKLESYKLDSQISVENTEPFLLSSQRIESAAQAVECRSKCADYVGHTHRRVPNRESSGRK